MLCTSLFVGLNCAISQEGNYTFENYGNQSVLLNGNVTGSASDLGLTYYNPARLALIEKPSFVISGKAYQLDNYTLTDVFESEVDLSTSKFNGIPSIVAGTFSLKFLPKHKFAYAILSRYRSDIGINYSSGVQQGSEFFPFDDEVRRVTDIAFGESLREEWYGVSWAYPISENFGIGASLFGSIYQTSGRSELNFTGQSEDNSVSSYDFKLNYGQKSYGLFMKLGLAWKLGKVDMGANFSLPFIHLKSTANLKYEEFIIGVSSQEDFFGFADLTDLQSTRRTAASISLGAGIPIGKSILHLNGSWYSRVRSYSRIQVPEIETRADNFLADPFLEEFRSVVNFGMGANIYISESVKFIGSFSSDYGATVSSVNLFDVVNDGEEQVNVFDDFWHYGFGTDISVKWGDIVVGATYSRTTGQIEEQTDIPDDMPEDETSDIFTDIKFERWRFIVGLEIPLLQGKLKRLEQTEENEDTEENND